MSQPTVAQKHAGNYRKLHTTVHGLDLSIENEKGSERSGVDKDGKKWSVTMPVHYGYFKRTEGKDGDHVDVFLGPNPGVPLVYVVNQIDADTGRFDEHKVLLGFPSRAAALRAYHASFSDGKGEDRVGSIATLHVPEFKEWLDRGKRVRPVRSFEGGGTVNEEEADRPTEEGDDVSTVDPEVPDTEGEDDRPRDRQAPVSTPKGLPPGFRLEEPPEGFRLEEPEKDNSPPEGFRLEDDKPSSSMAGAFVRGAARGAAPAAGGLAGAGFGAAAGSAILPGVGTVLGGAAGALGGGYAIGKLQDWFMDRLGLRNEPQERADQEQHPYAEFAGELAPALAGFGIGKGAQLGARALGAGIQGGLEAAQEKVQGQDLDLTKIALAGGAGAVMNEPNRLGKTLLGAGESIASKVGIKPRPGRPDMKPAPVDTSDNISPQTHEDVQQTKQDAATSAPPRTARGVAEEMPAPPDAGEVTPAPDSSIGNPQSAPTVGEVGRDLGKKPATTDVGTTIGDTANMAMAPDEQLAIRDALGVEAPETTTNDELYDAIDARNSPPEIPETKSAGPAPEPAPVPEVTGAVTPRGPLPERAAAVGPEHPAVQQRNEERGTQPTAEHLQAEKMARDAGMDEDFINRIKTAPPEKVRQFIDELGQLRAGQREAANRPAVKGLENAPKGKSEVDVRRKQHAVDAAQEAFDKFAPDNPDHIPQTAEERKTFGDRLRGALAHATEANFGQDPTGYKPRNPTAAQEWLRRAKSLAGTTDKPKAIMPKALMDFITNEKQLRSGNQEDLQNVRDSRAVEGGMVRNKRSGDDAIAAAEAGDSGPDAMKLNARTEMGSVRTKKGAIEKLERAQAASPVRKVEATPEELARYTAEANKRRFPSTDRVNPEEAEEWTKPKPLTAEEWLDKNDHAKLADNVTSLAHEADKPNTELTDKGTRSELNDKLSSAEKPQWERDAQAGAQKTKELREARLAAKSDREPNGLLKDTGGAVNLNRVRQDMARMAKPIRDWWVRNVQPELFSRASRYADPLFAETKARLVELHNRAVRAMDSDWHAWSKAGVKDSLDFIRGVELGQTFTEPWKQAAATLYRQVLDDAFKLEAQFGSPATYLNDYFPHIWKDNKKAVALIGRLQNPNDPLFMGHNWFTQQRMVQFIDIGLANGLELRSTNPSELVTRRLMASIDMTERMRLLHNLNATGLSYPVSQAPPGVMGARSDWQTIFAADRNQWVLAPDVAALWKNAIEARGLWDNQSTIGSAFRGWMKMKAVWAPIKLIGSAFHPLHLALGVVQSDNFARGWQADGLAGALREGGKGLTDPLFAIPGLRFGSARNFIGKIGRDAFKVDPARATPQQLEYKQWMQEGGYVPERSEQYRVNGEHAFADAWNKSDYVKLFPAAVARFMEKVQAPIFDQWIPNLKTASYLRGVAAYLQAHPGALNDRQERILAFREIGKQVDNRYGEMFYGGLFLNRYMKDGAIGSFLSLGWNLGFLREFYGGTIRAPIDTTRNAMGRLSGPEKTIHDATNKGAYVAAYAMTTALMAGAMSYGLSGSLPSGMDFVFPRAGGTNPDGSPRRLTTMFFTREPFQATAHIQESGGTANPLTWGSGLGQMLWNKLVFEPVVAQMQNRDYFGYQVYDPNAPWYQQWAQRAKSLFGDALNPIVATGSQRAKQTGGGLRDQYVLPALGFNPAPAYVSKDAIQNRISQLFYEGPGAGVKPYANKERDDERRNARADLQRATTPEDKAAAVRKLVQSGINPKTLARERYGTADSYQFGRLELPDQMGLVRRMDADQLRKYVTANHGLPAKSRRVLTDEWVKNRGPLPQR